MRTVLLTGAGGYLGRHLLKLLPSAGIRVVAITSCSVNELSRRCGSDLGASGITAIPMDAHEAIMETMRGADFLLSCGFPRGGNGFEMACGLEFIAWLFAEACERGIGAVANVSSQSVYDQRRTTAAVEDDPLCPEGDYAIAKYATELMLETACVGIPHTSIRLASLIGPGFDQRVVNKMVKKAIRGEAVTVQENGSRFGYLDVRDASKGLLSLLDSDAHSWEQAYNLGPEGGYTLTEIGECAIAAARELGFEPADLATSPSVSEGTNTTIDPSRFKRMTGWGARISLAESARDIAMHELTDLMKG